MTLPGYSRISSSTFCSRSMSLPAISRTRPFSLSSTPRISYTESSTANRRERMVSLSFGPGLKPKKRLICSPRSWIPSMARIRLVKIDFVIAVVAAFFVLLSLCHSESAPPLHSISKYTRNSYKPPTARSGGSGKSITPAGRERPEPSWGCPGAFYDLAALVGFFLCSFFHFVFLFGVFSPVGVGFCAWHKAQLQPLFL